MDSARNPNPLQYARTDSRPNHLSPRAASRGGAVPRRRLPLPTDPHTIASGLLVLGLLALRPGGDEPLREDQRGSVQVKSDLPPEQVAEVHALAAGTRHEVEELLERLGIERKSKGLTRLRVYATPEGFEKRKLRTVDVHSHWAAAYFDLASNEVVTCWRDGSAGGRSTLRHEITHQILHEYVKNPPIWFNEGLATYIGNIQRDDSGDPLATVNRGHIQEVQRALQQERTCPLEELLELGSIEFYGREGTKELPWDRGILYAQSWSLVYFLIEVAEGEDGEIAREIFERMDSGRFRPARFRKRLPELEENWKRFLDDDTRLERDRLTRKAHELLREQKWPEALEAATAVLAQDSTRRAARRVAAEASLGLAEHDAAITHMTELLAQRPEDPPTQMRLAELHLAKAEVRQDPVAAGKAVELAIDVAEQLPASEVYPVYLFASKAAEYQGDLSAALEHLRAALGLRNVPGELRRELKRRENDLMRRAAGTKR